MTNVASAENLCIFLKSVLYSELVFYAKMAVNILIGVRFQSTRINPLPSPVP